VKIAAVFPGQGSFALGCASAWRRGGAAAVIDAVSAAAGFDVAAASDAEDTGRRTALAQPVIFASSMAAWHALTGRGVRPAIVAGHSLGEYAAATAAGVLSLDGGARVVATRATATSEACLKNPGSMGAVLKLERAQVDEVVAACEGLVVANDNAPGQIVVAGPSSAIEAARDLVRDLGGRLIPLEVEGPFHSPAMAPAVTTVGAAIAAEPVADPVIDLVSGYAARIVRTASDAVSSLVDGILGAVRWREVQQLLAANGITDLVEVGPGAVLTGIARRVLPDVRIHTLRGPDDLDAVSAALGAA
jgi:[acyl-carrier-protein] S-malonyltransferase